MDRCALFVDVGYALADGAMAVHGTRRRDSVSWDHAGLLKLLAGLARDRTGLPLLRCYWYETAEGGRTAEHDALAEMPGLKLRLVNTRPGRREGVESQLRRDLVTLAKSGAIADAFIASADEHLAEVVAEVQDLGLRVVVLHIASDGGWTIPQPLRQECDDIVEITGVHLRPFVELIQGAEPAISDEQFASAGYGSQATGNGDGSMPGATRQSALPAAALPAPAGGYPLPVSSDYGSAQPYANARTVHADAAAAYRAAGQPADVGVRSDQAIFASRGPESDGARQSAGQGHAGNAGQRDMGQAGAGGQGGGFGQQAAPGQYASADAGAPLHASGGPSVPPQGQSTGPRQNVSQSPGASAHSSQRQGMPQAPQGAGAPQHASGGSPQHASHGAPQHAAQGSVPPQTAAAGNLPSGNGAEYTASVQAESAQSTGPQSGGGQFGSGQPQRSHNRTQDNSAPQARYPDSGAGGMHAQGGGYQAGSAYQAGPNQNGTYQSGPVPGDYQNAAQRVDYQGASGPAGSGPGVTGQSAYHLSGLTGYQAGPGQSSYPSAGAGPAPKGAPGPGSYQVGNQNGSAVNGAPNYQDGAAQSGSGSYGSLGGYQPGGPQNGSLNGRGANSGTPHNAPAGFERDSAPQSQLYGASDPGYFRGQPPGAGPATTTGSHQRTSAGYPASQMQPSGPSQPQYQSQPHEVSALPAIRQPVAISIPDAVKAAHREGYSFGESVGRDAPGLWLEAVLARKPRMPSDLEARLLQGSVLPIDSLLHDEVRHSLRRGFWEALESARR